MSIVKADSTTVVVESPSIEDQNKRFQHPQRDTLREVLEKGRHPISPAPVDTRTEDQRTIVPSPPTPCPCEQRRKFVEGL